MKSSLLVMALFTSFVAFPNRLDGHALPDNVLWAPHVADGGFVVFDDVPGWPGPTRLVSELPHWYRQAGAAPNDWVVRKVAAGV